MPSDATIDAPVSGYAIVGYADDSDYNNKINPTSPTVSLVPGGSVAEGLVARNSSTVTVSGGTAGWLIAADASTVTVTGGTFGQVVGGNFFGLTSGSLTFVGTGLSDILTATTPYNADYTLTGTLLGGQSVTGDVVEVYPGGNMFTLDNVSAAPEPSGSIGLGVGLLGLSALGVKARRRRSVA